MTTVTWSKSDFDRAAQQLAFLLGRPNDDEPPLCHRTTSWAYEHDCLVTHTIRENQPINEPHDTQPSQYYDDEDTTFWTVNDDEDTMVCRNVPTKSDWFISICYSHIWQVPVLYFTVQMPDGTPFGRDDVLTYLRSYKNDLDEIHRTSDFISIDEHPVSGVPSYMIHPCGTTGRLDALLLLLLLWRTTPSTNSATVRLWSWMAMMLPMVGIVIRPSIFCQIQAELMREATNDV